MVWATLERFLGCVAGERPAGVDIISWVNGVFRSRVFTLKDVILPMAVNMWEVRDDAGQCDRVRIEIARILTFEAFIPEVDARAYVEALLAGVSSIPHRGRAQAQLDFLLTNGTRSSTQGESDSDGEG